ncbi:MAG: hypothetical protein SOZ34_01260, partial [Clostridia bacterium]|nr:hypothetical protein [Clostridia bacterium]
MKKITKKTLSAVVTAAMILSNLTALSVSADAATYADWTPREKNANVWGDYARADYTPKENVIKVTTRTDEQTRWTIDKYEALVDITEPGDHQAFTGARHLQDAY